MKHTILGMTLGLFSVSAFAGSMLEITNTDDEFTKIERVRSLTCKFDYTTKSRDSALDKRGRIAFDDFQEVLKEGDPRPEGDYTSWLKIRRQDGISRNFEYTIFDEPYKDPQETRDVLITDSGSIIPNVAVYSTGGVAQGRIWSVVVLPVRNQVDFQHRQYAVEGSSVGENGAEEFHFYGIARCRVVGER